jgi:hypothetical protein
MFNILVHRLLVETNISSLPFLLQHRMVRKISNLEVLQLRARKPDVKENHSSVGTSFSGSGGNDRSHGNMKVLVSQVTQT